MILKGAQRGGASSLAMHVLNQKDNDHIRVHDLRGVAATNAYGAFREMEAIASATKSTKPFFSVSFNPPPNASLTTDQFEEAFAAVEQKMGLEQSQRVVIFHEKNARIHAHVCWSVIQPVTKTDRRFSEAQEVEKLAAVKLGLYKHKLSECSKALFLRFGLELPKGFQEKGKADPLSYDRHVWMQCQNLKEDPRDLKALVRSAYQQSKSANALKKRLEEHGLFLCCGKNDKFLMLHHTGKVLALTRCTGLKVKDLREHLGDTSEIPSVEQAESDRMKRITTALHRMKDDLRAKHERDWQPFKKQVHALKMRQRQERKQLQQKQDARTHEETLIRANRLRKGLTGWWDRFTGDRGRTITRNQQEIEQCQRRDHAEREALIAKHRQERRPIQAEIDRTKQDHTRERQQFRAKMGFLLSLDASEKDRNATKDHIQERDADRREQREADRGTGRERTRTQGPDDPSP